MKAEAQDLFGALADLVSPCEGCQFHEACGDGVKGRATLACVDFVSWIRDGVIRNTDRIPLRIIAEQLEADRIQGGRCYHVPRAVASAVAAVAAIDKHYYPLPDFAPTDIQICAFLRWADARNQTFDPFTLHRELRERRVLPPSPSHLYKLINDVYGARA